MLEGGSTRAVLGRLADGDPLAVRPRVVEHLRAEGLFLEVGRVHLRALALCALDAARAPARGSLGLWIDRHVRGAARAVAKEDRAAADRARGDEPGGDRPPRAGAHSGGAPLLEVARRVDPDPHALLRACAALNVRPREERLAFQSIAVERTRIDDVAHSSGTSISEVARRARRALEAALGAMRGAHDAGRDRANDGANDGADDGADDTAHEEGAHGVRPTSAADGELP